MRKEKEYKYKNNAESKSGVFRSVTKKGKIWGEGVKREKRRGRKSGLAFVPAARLRPFCFQTPNVAAFEITEA